MRMHCEYLVFNINEGKGAGAKKDSFALNAMQIDNDQNQKLHSAHIRKSLQKGDQ